MVIFTVDDTEGFLFTCKHSHMEVNPKEETQSERENSSSPFCVLFILLSRINFQMEMLTMDETRNFLVHYEFYHVEVYPKQNIQVETK